MWGHLRIQFDVEIHPNRQRQRTRGGIVPSNGHSLGEFALQKEDHGFDWVLRVMALDALYGRAGYLLG